LCQRDMCYFMSYDPRFKEPKKQVHLVEVKADKERQDLILNKIELAHAQKEAWLLL